MNNDLAPAVIGEAANTGISFFNPDQFAHAQRVAKLFADSALVPRDYQNNIPNCVIALDIAARTGSSPMMVMQNLYMVHGKPSWSSQYIIASVNSLGRFTPLEYEITDLGPLTGELLDKVMKVLPKGLPVPSNKQCVAYSWDRSIPQAQRTKANNNRLESAPVSIAMAIQEGWYAKSGSKWQTMPDLMMRYRAATFFGRMYAPEKLMGMPTQEEAGDIIELDPLPAQDAPKNLAIEEKLNAGAGSTRRRRGASAAAPTVDTGAQSEPVAGTNEPATTADETSTTDIAREEVAGEKSAEKPADEKPAVKKLRCTVEKADQLQLPDNRLITKVELKGEFTGSAFFEAPLIKFAQDGAVIDAVMEQRPHKTKPNEFVDVLVSYEVVGG